MLSAFVAIVLQPCGIRWHERKPLDLAEQPDITGRRIKRRLHSPERVLGYPVVSAVVIEGARSRPLGAQQVQTGVGDRAPLILG